MDNIYNRKGKKYLSKKRKKEGLSMLSVIERERERDIFNNNEQLEKLNDVELVILAKNDNEQAIRILINRYRNLFLKIISKYYIANIDKEDLFSECLICLYIAIRDYNFNSKISFKTFLYFIIKKRIYALIRNCNRQKRNSKEFVELEKVNISIEDKKEVEYENKEVIESIKNKLSELELKVLEKYLENYSVNEIANLLNFNLKVIDNAFKRIKIKLKEVVSNV
jgi:RNA polymerase sporulation-specific sigma factor